MKIMRLAQWWDFGYFAQNLVEINMKFVEIEIRRWDMKITSQRMHGFSECATQENKKRY